MPTLARLLTALFRRTPPVGEPSSDGELLTNFATTRDATAFELLVWRHGAAVLGVCRRILRHEQSAEDAFQATFLILAKRAGSVRGQLAGWLHTTARRVCLRLAKRKPFAALETDPPANASPDFAESGELAAVLDAEIDRLPEKFRLAVILCYLHGLTAEQAAERLGVPRGTVLSRLATARKRLAERLTAKGVTVPAAFLTTAATTTELAAEVCTRTATVAVGFLTATIPATFPIQLATEVLSMTTRKAMIGAGLAATLLMAGVGTGLGWALADDERKQDGPKAAQPAAKGQPAKPPVPSDLGSEHPAVKRREEQLEEIKKRINVEEHRLLSLLDDANKIGLSNPIRTRMTEEFAIDLTKKVFDTQLSLAGGKLELKEAEEAFKKVSGKADERQKLAAEVLAITEKVGEVAVREKELTAAIEKFREVADKQKYEAARDALATAAKDRLAMESLLRARQQSLEAVTASAAEADAKRQAAERAKTNVNLLTGKLTLLQEKLDKLTAEVEQHEQVQRRLRTIQPRIELHESQLRKLRELRFELELPTNAPSRAVAEPEDKFDRILKLVEELRREVKELRDGKK